MGCMICGTNSPLGGQPMRDALWFVVLLGFCAVVQAEHPRMVMGDGRIAPVIAPTKCYVVDGQAVADTASHVDLDAWLAKHIAEAERLLRSEPADNASALERSQFLTKRNQQVHDIIAGLANQRVRAKFRVDRVIELPPPKAPGILRGDASEPMRKLHAQRVEQHRAAVAEYAKRRYCIVGRPTGRRQAADAPLALRKMLADASKEARVRYLQRWRDQVPTDFVLLHAGDKVATWKAGQIHVITGSVRKAGLFWFVPRLPIGFGTRAPECTYAKVEVILRPTAFDPPRPEPGDQQPAADADEQEDRARAAFKLAENYIRAERVDLARQQLRQIVQDYPGTKAAADAQRLLRPVLDEPTEDP
jgi:hypothetical protein